MIYLTKERHNTLEVVPHVELDKYLGKWYEIAHLPARFQEGCTDTTATYTLSKDGNISVLNECIRNGKVKRAKGKAKVIDKNTGAKLKVTFFWPFSADYWIIYLGKDYDYAVVGTPNRKYLWILSRTPQMDDRLFSQLIESVKSKGFDVSNLIITSQKLYHQQHVKEEGKD
jgi:apolipoprotein D and lipocalin family protein